MLLIQILSIAAVVDLESGQRLDRKLAPESIDFYHISHGGTCKGQWPVYLNVVYLYNCRIVVTI
jgi:hypothetical protein